MVSLSHQRVHHRDTENTEVAQRLHSSKYELLLKKPHNDSISRILDQFDELTTQFGSPGYRNLERLLSRLAQAEIDDLDQLVRLHELFLFVRAYPGNTRVLRRAESQLKGYAKRVARLREAGVDLSPIESPEVSGIAGTSVTDTFTFPIVRWLVARHPGRTTLAWDWFEDENRLSEGWPRFMPLLAEDALVEANVPYPLWLKAAKGRSASDVEWLVRRFDSLKTTEKGKAELFDAQNLYVTWTPPYRATRTGMRLQTATSRKVFYHREQLIQRRDVSLKGELKKPATPLERLSPTEGEAVLDQTSEASTIRYRELYGFTYGDKARVFKTHLGRGVDLFIVGLPAGERLPLRAYHAAMIFKNGVAVGYFEGLSLFERMESGFNLYYTFRDGETAWLYARILNLFHHLLGVRAFAIDPYQIGYENEEGIESGAFWFYRKLGFRPVRPEILRLVLSEEEKLASRKGYRTSAATLRKIAAGPMIFELGQSRARSSAGDWDRFAVRNIGLAVTRRMGLKFGGDAERFRAASVNSLNRILGRTTSDWNERELTALSDFAVTLSLAEDLSRWTEEERQALVKVIRAKAGADEGRYLRALQKHPLLRRAMIKLGS